MITLKSRCSDSSKPLSHHTHTHISFPPHMHIAQPRYFATQSLKYKLVVFYSKMMLNIWKALDCDSLEDLPGSEFSSPFWVWGLLFRVRSVHLTKTALPKSAFFFFFFCLEQILHLFYSLLCACVHHFYLISFLFFASVACLLVVCFLFDILIGLHIIDFLIYKKLFLKVCTLY